MVLGDSTGRMTAASRQSGHDLLQPGGCVEPDHGVLPGGRRNDRPSLQDRRAEDGQGCRNEPVMAGFYNTSSTDLDSLTELACRLLGKVEGDNETRQAVGDWHYWVGMGYEF